MKRSISLLLLIMSCFMLIGCGNSKNEDTSSNATDQEKIETIDTKTKDTNAKEENSGNKETDIKILKQGEEATIKTDYGSYKMKVNSINFMPKTDYRNAVIQFVYEYENIDFKTGNSIGGVILSPTDFKLIDENGYVLSTMDRGWKDEMQEAKILKPGEKCIAKMTYKINSEDIKKVKITMDRLDQMNTCYEIDVTR